jgi:hypothetical protein
VGNARWRPLHGDRLVSFLHRQLPAVFAAALFLAGCTPTSANAIVIFNEANRPFVVRIDGRDNSGNLVSITILVDPRASATISGERGLGIGEYHELVVLTVDRCDVQGTASLKDLDDSKGAEIIVEPAGAVTVSRSTPARPGSDPRITTVCDRNSG